MGYTVLYIAFGVVALWLLAEVLYQHKARLRWRLLTFGGFLGVASGVVLALTPLIVAGALAFGVGQTLVTLSHRKGFTTGWALGARPGSSRRRRGATAADAQLPPDDLADGPGAGDADAGPADASGPETTALLDGSASPGADPYTMADPYADTPYASDTPYNTSDTSYASDAPYAGAPYAGGPAADQSPFGGPQGAGAYPEGQDPYAPAAFGGQAYGDEGGAPVYSPTPAPEDTGEYGVYGDRGAQPYAAQQDPAGYGADGYGTGGYGGGWPVTPEDDVFANGAPAADPSYGGAWGVQQPPQPAYDPYAADPYAAAHQADPYAQQGVPQQQAAPGGYGQAYDYGQAAYAQPDPYAQQGMYGGQDGYGYGNAGAGGYQQQQAYGYDATAWQGAQDGTQPYIPQQGAPTHDNGDPADPYQQQYQQYQGYGY